MRGAKKRSTATRLGLLGVLLLTSKGAAGVHAAAGLPHVVGGDYMVEHWLAAYAVLLLS